MKKINVLEIIGSLHVGGAEKSLLTFLKNIDRTRFAPVIVTMFRQAENGFFAKNFEQLGFPIYHLELSSWRDFKTLRELRKIIRRHHIHIAHSHVGSLEWFGSLFAFLNGVRIRLYTKHNHRIKHGLGFTLQRVFLNHLITQKILSISQFVTEHLVSSEYAPRRKIELVFNPIEISPIQPEISRKSLRAKFGLPENKYVIGNTSRYEILKGFDILYSTCQQLIKQGFEIHIAVIGSDHISEEHQKLQKLYGVEKSATIVPFQENPTDLYRCFDCFFFTSRHTEGFGMVLLEAMALELPVVGLNVGVIAEVVHHYKTGLLPYPVKWQEEYHGDAESAAQALADAIIYLIANPNAALALGKRAHVFAKQFDITNFTRRVETIYSDLYHHHFER